MEFRSTTRDDLGGLRTLYELAFPTEDLFPLVTDLLAIHPATLSLAAVADGRLAGHVIFTYGRIASKEPNAALLGPICVRPECQRHGIGSTLIRTGLQRLRASVQRVLVLGDPAYYGRYGFTPEPEVTPPYPLPLAWLDAWQSRPVDGAAAGSGTALRGPLVLPEPWLQPKLWSP